MGENFRSIESSNPAYGLKNLQFITVKSHYLKGRGDICMYIPENCPAGAPVIILLHGVYGSAWSWPLSSGVHEMVDAAIQRGEIEPVILLMPSDGLWGDGSGYLKQKNKDFEKWITRDVIHAARQIAIEKITLTSKFFIAGLSMGGYGAMRIGARNPEIFSAFSGLSSITDISEFGLFVEEDLSNYTFYPEDLSLIDCFKGNREGLQPFRFDCGKNDLLIEYNRKLHLQLDKLAIQHVYEESSGEHSWEYWRENIMETIIFFNLHF